METEFRHKIRNELYDLMIYDSGPDETVAHTIVKRTACYVYVRQFCDRPGRIDPGHLVRFSVADLERDGRDWNAANRMLLYTRPLPHWPLMPAIVTTPEPLAIR